MLADDHHLVRAGIRALVEKIPCVTVTGEAADGRQVLELVRTSEPDVLLLDLSMPGLNGIETLIRLQKDFPHVRVIVLSMHQTSEYVWQAMNSGAVGYLLKRGGVADLEPAIRSVARGKAYSSKEISQRLRKELPVRSSHLSKTPLERLTARQREILQLLAEGETTKGIALTLNLSNKTVEYHRAKLMECLNIFDIPGLVRFAMRTGVIAEEG